jgi:glycosyltransferase involved in cell wall biosynthesis
MREADAIVANTPRACDLLQRAYPEHAAKMTAITNGYDPEAFEPNPIPPLAGPTIEIVYTGMIYGDRSPNPFLEAVRPLGPGALAGKRLRVRLIGKVIHKEEKVEIEAKMREVENVGASLEDQVPYQQSIRTMVEADILLLLDIPGRLAGVPAKLYEYIGAGRPILALAEPESDVGWVLRESGIPYRIAPPLDREAIRRAFLELLHDPAVARGRARHEPFSTRFTRQHLAGELAAVLDSCQAPPRLETSHRSLSEAAR